MNFTRGFALIMVVVLPLGVAVSFVAGPFAGFLTSVPVAMIWGLASFGPPRSGRMNIVVLALCWLTIGLSIVALGFAGFLFYDSRRAGCIGAPKVVPFHQGMTLCPGQSAVIKLGMPAREDGL